MRPAYASICVCLHERNIKLQLSIENISIYSSAIFVLNLLRREAWKRGCYWHYDVIHCHRFQKASYRTVHTKTICIRFQMFPPSFEGKRIREDGFLNDTDQQAMQYYNNNENANHNNNEKFVMMMKKQIIIKMIKTRQSIGWFVCLFVCILDCPCSFLIITIMIVIIFIIIVFIS